MYLLDTNIISYLLKGDESIKAKIADKLFIGATALNHGAVLVTNNENHLGRIAGLTIENWI